jgi:hypothetical protein
MRLTAELATEPQRMIEPPRKKRKLPMHPLVATLEFTGEPLRLWTGARIIQALPTQSEILNELLRKMSSVEAGGGFSKPPNLHFINAARPFRSDAKRWVDDVSRELLY